MREKEGLVIELTDLSKRFGLSWVLTQINLRIGRGESVALFGGNGSGKSTLLKIIATILQPSTGTLSVLGPEAAKEKWEIRGRLRFLSHEKQLYGSLTVLENLKLAAGLRGLSSREADPVLRDVLERVRMTPFRDRQTGQLSEGMKKRVVLARLLIGDPDPELILLDEPYPGLDMEGRRILDELIQEWRRKEKTIVIASHDHEIALRHADRLIVLEQGRIGYDGPAKGQIPSKTSVVFRADRRSPLRVAGCQPRSTPRGVPGL